LNRSRKDFMRQFERGPFHLADSGIFSCGVSIRS
jgi:hypothetical protein